MHTQVHGLHGLGKQKGEDERTAREQKEVSADFADDADWKRKKEKQKVFNAEVCKGRGEEEERKEI